MKRKLLISGVTLGACVLAVSVIVSSAPSVISGPNDARPATTDSQASGPALSKSALQPQLSAESTSTDQILVAFTTAPTHPESAAIKAVAPAAARIAKATVKSAKLRYTGTVAVVLNKQVSHADAAKIAAKAGTAAGVDYAEPSLTFHPTDVSATAGSAAWNRTAIEADKVSSESNGSGVVVGIIDTGIAANPDLSKALLVKTTDGVVWNHTVSGTTWPNLTVTATWGDQRSATTTADDKGNWAFDFDALAAGEPAVPAPEDHSEVTLTVTDLATTTVKVAVDAVVTLTVDASNGTQISGTTDKGAQVVVTDIDNNIVCTATADEAGAFSCTPSSTLNHGDQLTVTATDAVGNATAKTVTIDKVPPARPTIDLSNGKVIHLTGVESGITPKAFDAESGGNEIDGAWTDKADGEWTFTPTTARTESDPTWIRLTDEAGNTTSTHVEIDATAPTAPSIDASNGKVIHLTGVESGITPKAFDAETDGTQIDGTWVQGPADGEWTFTPTTARTENDPTWIRLTDEAGNTTSSAVSIDATAPAAPVVQATDGQTLSGTAEGGAVITISYEDANATAQSATTTAQADGTWTTTLDPRAGDRTTLTATATDAVSNVSEPSAAVRVHYGPPSAPAVAPSNGTTVLVSAVLAGDVVSLVDANGAPLGSCVDNADLSWTCTPDPALTETNQAFVVVTDDAGQTSVPELVVVDTTVPTVTIGSATPTSVAGSSDEALTSLTISYLDTTDQTRTVTAVLTGLTWSAGLVDAKAGSTLTATGTDLVGNHSQATATITEPPSETSPTPTPEPADPAGPEGVDDGDAKPATRSTSQVSLDTSTSAGTVLPGYSFYDSTAGSYDATDPGTDSQTSRQYHGSHVAGIIAASGASEVTGVAPGVKILPIRVLGGAGSGGDTADIADAISWGAGVAYYKTDGTPKVSGYPTNRYPAKVLNLSLGVSASSCPKSLQNAIDAAVTKGTVVVVSAGNNNASFTGQAPANCKNVIVVTASSATNTRASYSNWGISASSSAWLIAAPGGSGEGPCYFGDCPAGVTSTIGRPTTYTDSDGTIVTTYAWPMAGTSQAAPHVSAVAALLLAKSPTLAPAQVATVLRATATAFQDGCPTGVCGSGIVNATKALEGIQAGPDSGTATAEVPVTTYPTASARLYQPSAPRVGSVLTATGSVSYGSASYQWYRGTTAIARATSARYTLTAADLGQRLKVRVSGIGWNLAYSSSSSAIAPGYITSLTRPKILGTRKVGSRLKATKGTWSVATSVYRYRWYRNGKVIRGATGRTYKLTGADRRKRITVRVYVKATGYYSRNRISSRTATIR